MRQIAKARENGREIDRDTAFVEVVADSMETMLSQGDIGQMMAELKQQDKTLWEKVREWFRNLADSLKAVADEYRGAKPESPEGRLVAQMDDFVKVLQQAYAEALVEAGENYRANEGNKKTTREGGDVRYMARDGILTEESTEQERYNLLKDENITVSTINEEAIKDVNLEEYNTRKKSSVTPGLVQLAGKLGILNVDLKNSRIEFPFQYSVKNLRKSIHHQLDYGGTYQDYVKAMSCFDQLIENAIPIEVHGEKKVGTSRENKDLKRTYVLVSAYMDGNSIVPVEFEVKVFWSSDPKLYLVVALTKIDSEVLEKAPESIDADTPSLFPESTYSLQSIFRNVNPKDGRFLKYVPDGFLDEAQRKAKAEALANQKKEYESYDTAKKSDREYLAAVERGDMAMAQRMVNEAAKRWGAFLNNPEANEVFKQNGDVRIFYHGTNTGDFTVFDKTLLGSSSGDLGWFGKGFYFAFDSREAGYYGGRVISAYLKMNNPYDYSQLYRFKGSEHRSERYSRFAWLYNVVKQFPDIVKDQKVYAYPNNAENGTAVTWRQIAGWMDRIEKEKKFSVEQVEMSDGTTAWELRADPKEESFTNDDGETFTWTEYGMRQIFNTEQEAKEPINQVGAYLSNVMGVETIPRRSIEKIDFAGAVQRAGYDGIIQSPSGDEAVVFEPSQIKSSDPVTYDDAGNVIPLSERFDTTKADIRYSDRDAGAEKVAAALKRQNAKLKEDVKDLRELVRLQGKLTHGTEFTKRSIEAAMRSLIKTAGSKLNADDRRKMAGMLKDLYRYIAGDKELTWDGVEERAGAISDLLMNNVNIKAQRDAFLEEVLRALCGSKIRLSDSQRAEVEKLYGYENYRKMLFGAGIYLSRNGEV